MEHVVLHAIGLGRLTIVVVAVTATFGGLVVLGSGAGPAGVSAVVVATPSPLLSPPVYDPGPPQPANGAPAIKLTNPGHVPAYSAGDAEAFIRSQPLPRMLPGSRLSSATATFRDAADVSATLEGTDVGRPAGTLVCYVELQGTFYVATPPKQGQPRTYLTLTNGFAVFDATSGNLLLSGGRP